jgi:hypothetical protein
MVWMGMCVILLDIRIIFFSVFLAGLWLKSGNSASVWVLEKNSVVRLCSEFSISNGMILILLKFMFNIFRVAPMGCSSGKVVMGLLSMKSVRMTGMKASDEALISRIIFLVRTNTVSERPRYTREGTAVKLFLLSTILERVEEGPITSGRDDSRFVDNSRF